jgi:hypothetical protein
MDDVFWDPQLPSEWEDNSQYAIIISPEEKISNDQLRTLRKMFVFEEYNLASLRKCLSAGINHVLASGLHRPQVNAIVPQLQRIGLSFEVVASDDGLHQQPLARKVKPDFEY